MGLKIIANEEVGSILMIFSFNKKVIEKLGRNILN